jgi:hypothetical protein
MVVINVGRIRSAAHGARVVLLSTHTLNIFRGKTVLTGALQWLVGALPIRNTFLIDPTIRAMYLGNAFFVGLVIRACSFSYAFFVGLAVCAIYLGNTFFVGLAVHTCSFCYAFLIGQVVRTVIRGFTLAAFTRLGGFIGTHDCHPIMVRRRISIALSRRETVGCDSPMRAAVVSWEHPRV